MGEKTRSKTRDERERKREIRINWPSGETERSVHDLVYMRVEPRRLGFWVFLNNKIKRSVLQRQFSTVFSCASLIRFRSGELKFSTVLIFATNRLSM